MNTKFIILETRYQQEKSSPQAKIYLFVILSKKRKKSHQKLPKFTEPKIGPM